jgi:ParB-like chromosome segregation protein Spo0J
MKLKLTDIKIGERQRLNLGDLNDLDSMADKDVGQILPIVVHKLLDGYELVDGRRRLAKANQLGWDEIEVFVRETMDVVQKNKCELFADIARLDREWQDTCLSVAKIHYLMLKEKREQGESWGYRQTAAATGFGKTYIGRLLELAEALERTPKDEEVWKCENFFTAYQLLAKRAEAEARTELERRRAILNQQEGLIAGIVSVEEEKGPWVDMEETQGEGESPVHKVDETAEQEKVKIYLQGTNKDFVDCVPDVDFFAGMAYCIIGYNTEFCDLETCDRMTKQCQIALRDSGHAVFWHSQPHIGIDRASIWMGWPLIWNKIAYCDSVWPFCSNYGVGYVMAKEGVEVINYPNPTSSVVSAMPNADGSLPANVIDFTLKACCPPNLAVICLNSEMAVPIAECGHIPVWFEPDKAKFDKVCQDLKDYYEHNIPNVEVRMR